MVRINHKPYRLCQNVDFKVGNGCASDVNIDIYSLLPGNARNTPTSLQHTLSFQLPWRPWAQCTTLHTISSKTLAAR